MSEVGGRYVRARAVLWRSGPGVVLIRQVSDLNEQFLELTGGARLLWLALEQPASAEELAEAFEAPAGEVEQALDMLKGHHLVIPA